MKYRDNMTPEELAKFMEEVNALDAVLSSLPNPSQVNDEETGKWVILSFFPNSPTDVYGLFDSEQEARDYAERHGFSTGGNAYQINMVLNAHYHENPSDYVGMGWVGKDGRP